MNAKEKAMEVGVQFGMNLLKLVPIEDELARESHILGVLVVFLGVMRSMLGDEYAQGFLGAELDSLESDVPLALFVVPRTQ